MISAGACTRKSAELETGGDRGVEGEVVPQQLNCAHEQQPQATIRPPLPWGVALANCPRTMTSPRMMLHIAFTVLLSVRRWDSAIYLVASNKG